MAATSETPEKRPRKLEPKTYYAEPKTFADLGIDIGADKLNLVNDLGTSFRIVNQQTGDQKFFRIHHHPFSGEHLSEFMTQATPFKRYAFKAGIDGDLRMPIDAKRGREIGKVETNGELDYMRLDRLHRNDSEIGASYTKLVDTGVPARFLKALFHSASDSVYEEMRRVAFIRGKNNYIQHLFLQCESALQQGDNARMEEIFEAAFLFPYRDRALFTRYLNEKKGPSNDIRRVYWSLGNDEQASLLKEFLSTLNSDQRSAYASSFGDRLLIDLDTKKIVNGYSPNGFTNLRFVEDEVIEISNRRGTVVKAYPGRETFFGQLDWKTESYEFSPSYLASAIYPIIAWDKSEDGQRRFLDQQEVKEVLHSQFRYSKWGDAKLGTILAAYCSPEVTKRWPPLMTLEGGKRRQRMMGGQMLLWPSLDTDRHPHATQLLNDEESIIPSLERYIEQTA